jgi:hypothetical protein
VVAELTKNRMPPARDAAPAGIADEGYRRELLALAKEFAALGDRALAYELSR